MVWTKVGTLESGLTLNILVTKTPEGISLEADWDDKTEFFKLAHKDFTTFTGGVIERVNVRYADNEKEKIAV